MNLVKSLVIKKVSLLYFLLVVAPIAFYISIVIYFSENIPYWDDYDTVLAYLNQADSARYQGLFNQHNEHRIFWNRLVVEGYYFLFGEINFRHLVFFGNLGLLLLVLFIFNLFKSRSTEIVLFIPILYLIFQPQGWENITWTTGSLQNYYILLFAFLSFYLWDKGNYLGRIAAVLFGALAAYTSANGLLVLFIIFFWEVAQIIIDYKSHTSSFFLSRLKLLSFLVTAILFLCFFYLKDYTSPDPHRSFFRNLSNYVLFSQYILMFLGSYMEPSKPLTILVGLLQLILFFYITYLRYYQKNIVNYLLSVFILLTALLIAIGRVDFGVDQALSSRYKILSVLFLVSMYCAIIEIWPRFFSRKPIIFALILLSVLFNIGSQVLVLKNLDERKNTLEEITGWYHTGKGLNYPNQERANIIIKRSIEKGTYIPPSLTENKY